MRSESAVTNARRPGRLLCAVSNRRPRGRRSAVKSTTLDDERLCSSSSMLPRQLIMLQSCQDIEVESRETCFWELRCMKHQPKEQSSRSLEHSAWAQFGIKPYVVSIASVGCKCDTVTVWLFWIHTLFSICSQQILQV